jgi:2,4-dienoyl-CoA reductase-like NADH-dependent reductase (Old Yellow Enzyme family)
MAGMPALFEPLRLGGIALANRNAVSPMCQHSAENGAANDWHLQHLGSLSLSGAGLVIVAQTAVEAAGRISHGRQGPRPEAEELLEVLADHRGIKPEQVFVGNGSDEGESR